MARDGGLGHVRAGGRAARAYAAWSAREIELQALATLAALAQISTPSAAHFLKSHQLLVQKFAADRDRQRSSFKPFRMSDLHTVCRSFPKISSALSTKVCGGSRSAKILIQALSRQKNWVDARDGGPCSCIGAGERWHDHTGRPHCSADPGFCVPVTRLKRKAQRTGLRQSACDRSTIFTGAPCGGRPAPGAAESRCQGETKKAAQRLFGNQALTVKPVTPLSPPPRHRAPTLQRHRLHSDTGETKSAAQRFFAIRTRSLNNRR
jgi:hypothetical protein